MKKYKVFLSVKRNKEDKLVFESEEEKFARGFINNVTSYLEPFDEGYHDEEDKGRYYIMNGIEPIYFSKSYEIPT